MAAKWTTDDNKIAEVELQLSRILTEELTSRPAVSLTMLYASIPVQKKVDPLLHALEKQVGRELKADTTEFREADHVRKVVVVISNRFGT